MQKVGILLLTVAAILVVVGLFFVVQVQQSSVDGSGQSVAVTWGLLAEIVWRLTDGEVAIIQILPPGAELHGWEPTAETLNMVKNSRILLWTIEGLDDWALKISESLGVKNFKASKDLPFTLIITTDYKHYGHENHHDVDVHVWFWPENLKKMVANIAEALKESFPEKKDIIESNAKKLIGDIEAVERYADQKLQKFKGRIFITQHNAFQYLAERYGLKHIAILGFEEEEPSAAHLTEIYNIITREKIKVVYAEDGVVKPILLTISRDVGAKVMTLYTFENWSIEEVKAGRSFLDLYKFNVDALVEGFEGS